MLSVYLTIFATAATALVLYGSRRFRENPRVLRKNYAGREVPTAAGVVFAPVFLAVYCLGRALDTARYLPVFGERESLVLVVVGMSMLGLLDDLLGNGGASGFGGHLREAARGHITTGLLKAAGGFMVAAAASFPLSRNTWQLLLNTFIISLSANLMNLLDLRPGRAMKVFFPVLAVVVLLELHAGDHVLPYVFSLGGAAAVLVPGDLSERFMLGDAGSNVMGATLGFGLALGMSLWWKLGLAVFLAAANLLSEKVSFSCIIEANRVLRWLDGLGRKGMGEPGVK